MFLVRPLNNERGALLVIIASVMSLCVAFTAIMLQNAISDNRQADTNLRKKEALYTAEGVLEVAKSRILSQTANYRPVGATGTVTLNGQPVSYSITPLYAEQTVFDTDGLMSQIQAYLLRCTATADDVPTTVEKIIGCSKMPLFQFAIFYDDDLELLPGPNMTLSGRVHSNDDIYVGSRNTLTVDSNYFRSAGNIYLARKDDPLDLMGGTVRIEVNDGSGTFADLTFDSTSPTWTVDALNTWMGTVQSTDHGITELTPPSVQTIDAFVPEAGGDYVDNGDGTYTQVAPGTGDSTRGYYHSQADLAIIDGVAYNKAGADVTAMLPPGTITTATMYDGRENEDITVTEIDVKKLFDSGVLVGHSDPNGALVYATRSDTTAAQPNGIRLKNASELGDGFTVCSDSPVYSWGDYNSVNKKPAAIISDAVNILSNAWNDTKSAGTLPNASETIFNAALISGAYDTLAGAYNGGLENLPRFHENWNGVPLHIRGSFVNIFNSQYAQGLWVYGGDNYTAPVRDWNYDTDFNNSANLPPYTPISASVFNVVYDAK